MAILIVWTRLYRLIRMKSRSKIKKKVVTSLHLALMLTDELISVPDPPVVGDVNSNKDALLFKQIVISCLLFDETETIFSRI